MTPIFNVAHVNSNAMFRRFHGNLTPWTFQLTGCDVIISFWSEIVLQSKCWSVSSFLLLIFCLPPHQKKKMKLAGRRGNLIGEILRPFETSVQIGYSVILCCTLESNYSYSLFPIIFLNYCIFTFTMSSLKILKAYLMLCRLTAARLF